METAGVVAGSDVLTHSSEQTYMNCPRMYYWAYERGWRPGRTKKPLRIGTAVHVGLDALAKGLTIETARVLIDAQYDEYDTEAATWPDAVQARYDLSMECVAAKCLVEGYAKAWSSSPVEILESERNFDLPITNPETGAPSRTFRQAGKRDRICKLPDGRIALMETKTVGQDISPDSDYWRLLALNQQVSKYVLAARADGYDVETTIYDVIRKPTIKPNPVPRRDVHGDKIVLDEHGERVYTKQHKPRQTADTAKGYVVQCDPMTPKQWNHVLSADISSRPEYYYCRKEVARLDSDLEEYRHELWWLTKEIQNCRLTGRWFRNCGACRRYNSLCSYYPLCAGEVDVTAGVPAGFRQAETVHEELDTPDKETEE